MPTLDVTNRRTAWLRSAGLFREERIAAVHGVTQSLLGDMKEPACRKAALRAAGLEGDVLLLDQVHGTQVHRAVPGLAGVPGDGWVSDTPGLCVGVYTADCLPIFIWSRDGGKVGVFHAGWRGLAAGMPKKAVEAFSRFGCGAGDLRAAVGPHIGPCCYEVGTELRSRFRTGSFLDDGTLRLDLGREARMQLTEAGIGSDSITVSGDCTSCLKEDLFSYRREGKARRTLSFIAAAG